MQDQTVLLPSPNSAFTRLTPRLRKRVFPSSPVCKQLLFGGSLCGAIDLKAELNETMHNHRIAFANRWKCRCDIIVCNCDENKVEATKQKKIPKFDWIPIDPLSEDEDENFEILSFTEETVINNANRPDAPVPFHRVNTSLTVPTTGLSTNVNFDENKENVVFRPLETCPTPPSSLQDDADKSTTTAHVTPIPFKPKITSGAKKARSHPTNSAKRKLLLGTR